MNFVTDKLLQLVRIEGFAERLLTNEGSVEERLSPLNKPREYLTFEKAVQPLGISGRRFVVLHPLEGTAYQGRGPPLTCILAQSCQRSLVVIMWLEAEQLEGAPCHLLVAVQICKVILRFGIRCSNC